MSRWWPAMEPRTHPTVRLLCLPYAGGRPSIFADWPRDLPGHVDVRALALPGRATRQQEIMLDEVGEVVGQAADAARGLLDVPWVVFGHSMGAILAFELVRELRRRGAGRPAALVVAGQDAPDRTATGGGIHRLSDAELTRELSRLAGTPSEVLEDTEVMALLLPALRADFKLCETYTHVDEPPLDAPLWTIDALGDPETTEAGVRGWGRCTTDETHHITLPGRHFCLHEARVPVVQAVARVLGATT